MKIIERKKKKIRIWYLHVRKNIPFLFKGCHFISCFCERLFQSLCTKMAEDSTLIQIKLVDTLLESAN